MCLSSIHNGGSTRCARLAKIRGAKIRADGVRKRAAEAIREADRAEAEARSIQMEGYAGPAQPSPTIAQCLTLRRADIAPSSK
jgi:hypothetical protein